MALIIKGDMPKDCFCCDELVTMSLCPINLNEPLKYCNGERHPDCPILGEISDKHGVLKDENVIKDVVMKKLGINSLDFLCEAERVIVNCIEQAPTVLEASK